MGADLLVGACPASLVWAAVIPWSRVKASPIIMRTAVNFRGLGLAPSSEFSIVRFMCPPCAFSRVVEASLRRHCAIPQTRDRRYKSDRYHKSGRFSVQGLQP